MSDLPEGWAEATLQELAGAQGLMDDGDWIESKDQDPYGDVRLVQLADIGDGRFIDKSRRFLTSERAAALRCTNLEHGDLLIARMPDPLGRACIFPGVGQAAVTAVDICIWRTSPGGTDARWLMHTVNSPEVRKAIQSQASGTTRQRVSGGNLKRLSIPVPPPSEQRRIVAKLDSLRARSGRARHELNFVPKLIERYKQAILAEAFSGKLTADWRSQCTDIDTGSAVLGRIDSMRAILLESVSPGRRGPISDGEAGRVAVELPDLPATWERSTLDHITNPTRLIQYGILKPGQDVPGGVPYVKVMNIQGGHVRREKIRRTTAAIHAQYRRSAIAKGDILLSIRGTVGRLAFVPQELDGGNITQDSVRIDVLPAVNSKYVYWYLHSPAAQAYFTKNQKGVAVRGINVGDVRPMEIPIPPEAEQAQIVSMIEHALVWLEKIAMEHSSANHLVTKLEQALLRKAFRGELVPQDPNDEPASILLERIRAERRGTERSQRQRRQSR